MGPYLHFFIAAAIRFAAQIFEVCLFLNKKSLVQQSPVQRVQSCASLICSSSSAACMGAAITGGGDGDTRIVGSELSLADASAEPAEKTTRTADSPLPRRLVSAGDSVTLVKRGGRFLPADRSRLKNSLLGAVGFLELANAGDFAANVWNDLPIPVFVVVLMALGGSAALLLSLAAFKDARLSWHNICCLRAERRILKQKKLQRAKGRSRRTISTRCSTSAFANWESNPSVAAAWIS